MRSTQGMSLKGRSLAGFGLCALLLFCGLAAAQDTPTPDNPPAPIPQENPTQYSTLTEQPRYSLKGTVVNAVTGEAIRGALVALESSGPQGWTEPVAIKGVDQSQLIGMNTESVQLTDLRGQFEFANLSGGQARLTARKPGFFSEYGPPRNQRSAPPVWVGLDAPPVVIRLVPESVISGKITNENNEPVEAVSVHLIREAVENGRRFWVAMSETRTNEDGEFRMAELDEGTYYVEAGPWWRHSVLVKEPNRRGFHRAFFPDARDFHAASPIALGAGQKFRADLQLTREPFYKVTGMVTGQTGGDLQLECQDAAGETLSFPVTVNAKESKFEFQLPAGSWVIHAREGGDPGLIGKVALRVAGDIKDVTVKLAPELGAVPVVARLESVAAGEELQTTAGDGSGRSTGSPPPPPPQDAADLVSLVPEERVPWAENYSPQPLELPSGTISAFPAMRPGRYRLVGRGDSGMGSFSGLARPGWYVKSAQSGAVDLLRDDLSVTEDATPQAIEVVFRDDGAMLTGVVTAQNRPSAGAVLLVSESIPLYNRVLMAGADGKFAAVGLAPGDYRILALEDGESLAFAEPQVWAGYAGQATLVRLEAGQQADIRLERFSSGRQVSSAQ